MDTDDNDGEFIILMNAEEQYSLWSAHHAIPDGWREVGPRGSREDCVSYINETWADMRPKSLREALEKR